MIIAWEIPLYPPLQRGTYQVFIMVPAGACPALDTEEYRHRPRENGDPRKTPDSCFRRNEQSAAFMSSSPQGAYRFIIEYLFFLML